MQLINSKEYGGHFLVSILFFSFYLIKDNFVEKFKTDKNKFEGLNNITPIISINDNSIRPAIHRPLSRTNGSEPSPYQTTGLNGNCNY